MVKLTMSDDYDYSSLSLAGIFAAILWGVVGLLMLVGAVVGIFGLSSGDNSPSPYPDVSRNHKIRARQILTAYLTTVD